MSDDLVSLPSVSLSIAFWLANAGFRTLDDLAACTPNEIRTRTASKVANRLGAVRAGRIMLDAKLALDWISREEFEAAVEALEHEPRRRTLRRTPEERRQIRREAARRYWHSRAPEQRAERNARQRDRYRQWRDTTAAQRQADRDRIRAEREQRRAEREQRRAERDRQPTRRLKPDDDVLELSSVGIALAADLGRAGIHAIDAVAKLTPAEIQAYSTRRLVQVQAERIIAEAKGALEPKQHAAEQHAAEKLKQPCRTEQRLAKRRRQARPQAQRDQQRERRDAIAELSAFPGIRPNTAERLVLAGIRSIEDLASCAVDDLCGEDGLFHETRERKQRFEKIIMLARIEIGWMSFEDLLKSPADWAPVPLREVLADLLETACPWCRRGGLDSAKLIENDEAFVTRLQGRIIRRLWEAHGRAVSSEALITEMYAGDPEGGPCQSAAYYRLKHELEDMAELLASSCLELVDCGYRQGWRLRLRIEHKTPSEAA